MMTLRELNGLYYLNKLIERDRQKLAELEAQTQPGGMNLTGMPKAPGAKNQLEDLAVRISDRKDKIRRELEKYERERDRIEAYIQTLGDPRIMLIVTYRCVDLLSWQEVADRIGGGNTDYSVKRAFYRHIKSCPTCHE